MAGSRSAGGAGREGSQRLEDARPKAVRGGVSAGGAVRRGGLEGVADGEVEGEGFAEGGHVVVAALPVS